MTSPDQARTRSTAFVELVAVLLLGITTIGTAWCSYQATVWTGRSAEQARVASEEQIESARLFGLATQEIAYDSIISAQYAEAVAAGDTKLQSFYRTSLVRRDFLPVLDSWRAAVRAGRTPTPLADDADYVAAQLEQYRAAVQRAEASTRQGAEAGASASAYVSVTILLAAALFFSGVVPSFRFRAARVLLLVTAIVALAVAASRLAGLPVSF